MSTSAKSFASAKPIGGDEMQYRAALEECDEVRHYFVRCPACGSYQIMTEEGLVMTEKTASPQEVERRKLGRYKCSICKFLWSDHLRDQAVARGRWERKTRCLPPRRTSGSICRLSCPRPYPCLRSWTAKCGQSIRLASSQNSSTQTACGHAVPGRGTGDDRRPYPATP